MAGSGHGTKAVIAAMLANGGIAISKFVGFLLTRSTSMLAESVHSVADTGNQGLLLLGGRRARKPATAEHPFGFGRERYFWSFIVALILFSLGGMFAIYEGVEKILHPHHIESPYIAIGILSVGILLETFSFRTAIVEANKVKEPDTSWWRFIRGSKQPELPVVLLEDLAAEIGLIIALSAVIVSDVTGDAVWDGYGTLAIGILLVGVAIILAIEMQGLLIGEAATTADQQRIAASILAEPSVTRLLHMRTQHMGPDELLIGAKVELVAGLSVEEAAEVVNRVETSVRRAVPSARVLYLEPDIFRTAIPRGETAGPTGVAPETAAAAAAVTETDPAVGAGPVATAERPAEPQAPAEPEAMAPEATADEAEPVPVGSEPEPAEDEADALAGATGERGETGEGH